MNTLKFGNGEWYGKKDTILAYNDENSNFKPLPFSFDRASSATVVNKDGLIETVGSGEPRIDYSDDAKGALKLEPSRTNTITYSNDFSQSGWDNAAYPVTITSNSIISPDGSLNANLIAPSSGNSRHAIRNLSTSAVSGTIYTLSAFVKKGGSRYIVFGDAGDSLWRVVTFDLDNGVITNEYNSSGTITAYENGWYRITCVITRTNSGTIQFSLGASETSSNSGLPSFDNTSLTVYAYGCQIESNSSYATSYIPTSGGVVTRVADVCNNGGNDQVINSTEGVLYGEVKYLSNDIGSGKYSPISISGGTTNFVTFRHQGGVSNRLSIFIYVNNVEKFVFVTSAYNLNNYVKIAVLYSSNGSKVFINGTVAYTDTINSSFPSNTLTEVEGFQGGDYFKGNVKEIKLYNTALTDQELINLTTI